MTPPSHDTFAAFIGIAWADAKHDGCLQAAGTAKRECLQLEHTPEATDAWGTTLRTWCHGQPAAVGRELAKGPLVSALRTYDWLVLCPIKPLTLARYRAAFPPSRAQDDPPEAALQLARLLTHSDTLPPSRRRAQRGMRSPTSSHTATAWGATKSGFPIACPGRSSTMSHTCGNGCRTKIPRSLEPS
jgi:hypothetical protein